MSNTWVTCPALRDKPGKLGLIPDILLSSHGGGWKGFLDRDGLTAYQLVGGVMAYQGGDG